MKYAWIEQDKIRDIFDRTDFPLEQCYHPEIAKFFDTLVPDEAKRGDGWIDGQLVPQPEPEVLPEEVPTE